MSDTTEVLRTRIYPAIDKEIFLPELQPRSAGSYLELRCPECGKRRAFIYENGGYIRCNRRNECALGRQPLSLWDYVQRRDGLDSPATFLRLAEAAGYDAGELEVDHQVIARSRERRAVLAAAWDVFRRLLGEGEGRETRKYLEGRGYSKEDLEEMEVGHWPGPDRLFEELEGEGLAVEAIRELFPWKRQGYGLVFPYRSPHGSIRAFWGRLTRPLEKGEKEGDKYKPMTKGARKDTLFNLDQVKRREGLVVVEGYLDALLASARGLAGVVAAGGADLTDGQIDNALGLGFESFVIAFDGDEAGRLGTERALERLYRREAGAAFVAADLPEGSDPDSFIVEHGVRAWEEYVGGEAVRRGGFWLGRRWAEGIDPGSELEREALVLRAERYAAGLPGTRSRVGEELLLEVCRAAGVEYAQAGLELDALRQRQAERDRLRRLEQGLDELVREVADLRGRGEAPASVAKAVEERARELRAEAESARMPLVFDVERLDRATKELREGYRSGWPSLDRLGIRFKPTELALMAARTSHGKTSAMVGLLTNWLFEEEASGALLFYSCEEPEVSIYHRLLSLLSAAMAPEGGAAFTAGQVAACISGRTIQGRHGSPDLLKKAHDRLRERGKRLLVVYPNDYWRGWDVQTLCDHARMVGKSRIVHGVLLDYLQRIPAPAGRFDRRDIEVSTVARELKGLAVDLSCPVVTGAQINREAVKNLIPDGEFSEDKVQKAIRERAPRLHQLREGGSEQEADLVLGLHHLWMDYKEGNPEADDPEGATAFNVIPLKNRMGATGGHAKLLFEAPYRRLLDPAARRWREGRHGEED